MRKAFILAAAALMALVGCTREKAPVDDASREVRFTSSFENVYTVKSASLEDKTVRIVAGAPLSKSTDAAASGTALTPETKIYWNAEQTEKTTFVGIYPANGETGFTISNYYIAPSEGQFPYMEEFLTAVAKDVTPGSVVNLDFRHPFVKIVINIDNQISETPAISSVKINDVSVKGDLNLDLGTVTNTVEGSVTATENGGKYELIILPMEAAKPVIIVNVGTKAYTFKINTATDFVAGKSYTANLTLTDSTPAVVQGEEVSFTFSVTDWDAVATPLETVDVTGKWSVIGTVNDSSWGEDFFMTESATPGVLEASITFKTGNEFKLRKEFDWTVQAGMKNSATAVNGEGWDGFLEGDSSQSKNIVLAAPGVYTITFNPETYAFTATKTGDVTEDPGLEQNTFTLNVYDAAGYGDNIHLYMWVITDLGAEYPLGAWPGKAAEATDVVVAGNSFKSFVAEGLPLNSDKVYYIINDGNGTKQTADANLSPITALGETRYCCLNYDNSLSWIDDPAAFTPPAAPAGDIWVLVGLSNDWTTERVMSEVEGEPDARSIDITLGASAEAEGVGFKFKLQGDTTWDKQFGGKANGENLVIDATTETGPFQLLADDKGSGNIALTPIARQYKLKLYVSGENKGKLYVTLL